jgi:hypothetical protein
MASLNAKMNVTDQNMLYMPDGKFTVINLEDA